MAIFTRYNYTNTPPTLLEYADRNANQLKMYVETGSDVDRVFYGATDNFDTLMGVVGLIVGRIGGFDRVASMNAHGSCVQKKTDPIRQINIDIRQDEIAIHTVTYVTHQEWKQDIFTTFAGYCAKNNVEFISSKGANTREI